MHFLEAQIENIGESSYYQGSAFNYIIKLRLRDGTSLDLFDYKWPLCAEKLTIGESYHFVIFAFLPKPFQHYRGSPLNRDTNLRQATVLHPYWTAPKVAMRCDSLNREQEWVVVDIGAGEMLLEPHLFKARPVSTGDVVTWDQARYDLLGVL